MALDLLNGKVRVFNYELSPVGFPSQQNQNGVFLRGREEDEEFVMERVLLDDIEIENTKSDLFKVGRLRFHPDEENEIYKRLGIEDKENIMTDTELMDFLMDDSVENIRRISKIKSPTLLSRMKSILFSMERNNKIPPHNVSATVIERNDELKYGGKRKDNSQINRILETADKVNEDNQMKETLKLLAEKVERLEKENAEKDDLINKSQSSITDLLSIVENLKKENSPSNTTAAKKTVGRPKKDA